MVPHTPRLQGPYVAAAIVAVLMFITLCLACGAATPTRIQCTLDALKPLPRDPMQITPYDAVDLVNRLNSCEAKPQDAGTP